MLLGCLTHERDVFAPTGYELLCSTPVGAGSPQHWVHLGAALGLPWVTPAPTCPSAAAGHLPSPAPI